MNTIDPKQLNAQINKCYLDYDREWISRPSDARVRSFKYYLERKGGLKLSFRPKTDNVGRIGYTIDQIEIVDDKLFTLWLLRWS